VKALALLAIVWALVAAAHAAPSLERLRAEADAHPDDAAVVRALASALLAERGSDEALAVLRADLARHPERRAEHAQLLGRALFAAGEIAHARAALEEAVAYREGDAVAHLVLGLVALRLGESDVAARHLARAEELDPALAARVRALSASRAGAASRAAARVSLTAGVGFEYDTNSTLEGDEAITSIPGDRADALARYDAALGATLLRSDRAEIAAGYRVEQSQHVDRGELDVQSHGAFLGTAVALSPRAFLRLEGGGAWHRLDGDTHSTSASLASGVGWRTERRGALELRAQAEWREYAETPALASLERDGWRVGASAQHGLPIARLPGGALTTRLGYARTLTEAERDAFGWGPAFDSHLVSLESALRGALPADFFFDPRVGASAELFDERNAVDFLSDDGVGDLTPDRRRDWVVDASVALTRPITRWLDAQLRFRQTRHFSNVDVYDWDRQIVGTQLRLRWPSR
jgi:tetratricopeptide (TPR) repeat protein